MIENGPLSSRFILDYDAYQADGALVKETKEISIDLGSHFSKYRIKVTGSDVLTVGVTLHDYQGDVSVDESMCWINYTAPHDEEVLNTSVIAHPKYFESTTIIESKVKDQSHVLMHLKVIDGYVEFYSGFTWSASKHFANAEAWKQHLNHTAMVIQNPLVIGVE